MFKEPMYHIYTIWPFDNAAESGATRGLLRETIKYPPLKGPGDERAIDLSMKRGGAGKTLKEAPQARHFGLTSHDEEALASKEIAEYTDGPVDQEPCAACSMFESPSGCSAVRGEISPKGHCKFWEAKGAEDCEKLSHDEKLALDRASAREGSGRSPSRRDN
jgi:hypothetical protein